MCIATPTVEVNERCSQRLRSILSTCHNLYFLIPLLVSLFKYVTVIGVQRHFQHMSRYILNTNQIYRGRKIRTVTTNRHVKLLTMGRVLQPQQLRLEINNGVLTPVNGARHYVRSQQPQPLGHLTLFKSLCKDILFHIVQIIIIDLLILLSDIFE